MVSRRKILSRSRDDLHLDAGDSFRPGAVEEDDVWYQKEKLYKVRTVSQFRKIWKTFSLALLKRFVMFGRGRDLFYLVVSWRWHVFHHPLIHFCRRIVVIKEATNCTKLIADVLWGSIFGNKPLKNDAMLLLLLLLLRWPRSRNHIKRRRTLHDQGCV
jgi:hypothetical protein